MAAPLANDPASEVTPQLGGCASARSGIFWDLGFCFDSFPSNRSSAAIMDPACESPLHFHMSGWIPPQRLPSRGVLWFEPTKKPLLEGEGESYWKRRPGSVERLKVKQTRRVCSSHYGGCKNSCTCISAVLHTYLWRVCTSSPPGSGFHRHLPRPESWTHAC